MRRIVFLIFIEGKTIFNPVKIDNNKKSTKKTAENRNMNQIESSLKHIVIEFFIEQKKTREKRQIIHEQLIS